MVEIAKNARNHGIFYFFVLLCRRSTEFSIQLLSYGVDKLVENKNEGFGSLGGPLRGPKGLKMAKILAFLIFIVLQFRRSAESVSIFFPIIWSGGSSWELKSGLRTPGGPSRELKGLKMTKKWSKSWHLQLLFCRECQRSAKLSVVILTFGVG